MRTYIVCHLGPVCPEGSSQNRHVTNKLLNTSKFQVKIKEAMYINWERPALNQQIHHVNLSLSF